MTPLTLSRGVRYGLLLREICKLILSKINMGIKLTLDYIREYASSIGGILGQNNNYENNMQKLQKERDTIKTNYCKKNNISLLRIPYWEIENNSFKNKIISEVNRQNQVAL